MRQRLTTDLHGSRRVLWGRLALAVAASIVVATYPGAAKVKIRSESNKSFDFRSAQTWGWSPEGAGQVILARTADDDPEAVRQRVEPVIKEAVNAEMPRRGLQAATGTPDLTLIYYLLVSIGSQAQVRGQFLPAVTQWGLPMFTASTTSLKVIEQGSLVLDLSANGQLVWRGVGEAQIKMDLSEEKRLALVREAATEILKRYPSRK